MTGAGKLALGAAQAALELVDVLEHGNTAGAWALLLSLRAVVDGLGPLLEVEVNCPGVGKIGGG